MKNGHVLSERVRCSLTPVRSDSYLSATTKTLIKLETHFDTDLHSDGPPVFRRRIKAPLLDSLDGLLIKAHAYATLNADIVRLSIWADDHRQNAGSFNLRLAGLIGVLRVGGRKRTWSEHATSNTKHASSDSSSMAFAHARSRALANTTA